jgi:hypothetical protein
MKLRREFLAGVWILLGLNVLLAFGAIGLLTRMSPAIRDILEENVVSIEAAEVMLSVLAVSTDEPVVSAENRERFSQALRRAEGNVTESGEIPVLARIEAESSRAFRGERNSVSALTRALLEFSSINRAAMRKADEEARRLGTAGAWVAVFLAAFSLAVGLLVLTRLERRLVYPLTEIDRVLKAIASGDRYRRCNVAGLPNEIRGLFESLNAMLDRIWEAGTEGEGSQSPEERSGDPSLLDRAALNHLLEGYGGPAFVVDRDGRIGASNQEGLIVLGQPEGDGLRADLDHVVKGGDPPGSLEAIRLRDVGWLCILRRPVR